MNIGYLDQWWGKGLRAYVVVVPGGNPDDMVQIVCRDLSPEFETERKYTDKYLNRRRPLSCGKYNFEWTSYALENHGVLRLIKPVTKQCHVLTADEAFRLSTRDVLLEEYNLCTGLSEKRIHVFNRGKSYVSFESSTSNSILFVTKTVDNYLCRNIM
jgi:hypothetical protein